jgi:hypothetical protein
MEPQSSLPRLRHSATGPYPVRDESSPRSYAEWSEYINGRSNLGDLGLNGRILLNESWYEGVPVRVGQG